MCVCMYLYIYPCVYICIVDPHYLWASYLQIWASLEAQLVKNPPTMRETWVQSRGWEDPLEKGKATQLQYSGLENSMDCIIHGSQWVGHDWMTFIIIHYYLKIYLLTKIICNHKISICSAFEVIHRHVQSVKTLSHPMLTFQWVLTKRCSTL